MACAYTYHFTPSHTFTHTHTHTHTHAHAHTDTHTDTHTDIHSHTHTHTHTDTHSHTHTSQCAPRIHNMYEYGSLTQIVEKGIASATTLRAKDTHAHMCEVFCAVHLVHACAL